MAKAFISLPFTWSRRLPLQMRRYFASGAGKTFNEAPICPGRNMKKLPPKCHPRMTTCAIQQTNCKWYEFPECTEPDIKPPKHLTCCCDTHNLTRHACTGPVRPPPKHHVEIPFKSIWEVCNIETECSADIPERMDDMHYVCSDKEKRVYTQTWKSCDVVNVQVRKVCCFDDLCMLPPIKKRPKADCPQTAKEKSSEKLKIDYNLIRKCLSNVTENPNTRVINKCRKVIMPCCRKPRSKTTCIQHPKPTGCVKQCCPHPSFSECDRSALRIGPPVECRCNQIPMQCETDQFAIRKSIYAIPPSLPAWPPKERPK